MRDREDPAAEVTLSACEAVNVLRDAEEGLRHEVLDLFGPVPAHIPGDRSSEVSVEDLPCPPRARARSSNGRIEIQAQRHGGKPPKSIIGLIDPPTAADTIVGEVHDKRQSPRRSRG